MYLLTGVPTEFWHIFPIQLHETHSTTFCPKVAYLFGFPPLLSHLIHDFDGFIKILTN